MKKTTRTLKENPPQEVNEQDYLFRYGYRYRDDKMVPLSLEDILHPQEEDHVFNTEQHKEDDRYVGTILTKRIENVRGGYLTNDLRIDWGVPGVLAHSPDFAGFRGVKHCPPDTLGTFRVADYGAKCFFAMEIVSPNTRINDVVHKVDEYYRAGVPLYIIADQEEENGPRELIVYRRGQGGYRRGKLDRQGCVLIKPLGVRVGLVDNRLACFDTKTGKRLVTVLISQKEATGNRLMTVVVNEDEIPVRNNEEKKAKAAKARCRAEVRAIEEAERCERAKTRIRELEAELCRLRAKKS